MQGQGDAYSGIGGCHGLPGAVVTTFRDCRDPLGSAQLALPNGRVRIFLVAVLRFGRRLLGLIPNAHERQAEKIGKFETFLKQSKIKTTTTKIRGQNTGGRYCLGWRDKKQYGDLRPLCSKCNLPQCGAVCTKWINATIWYTIAHDVGGTRLSRKEWPWMKNNKGNRGIMQAFLGMTGLQCEGVMWLEMRGENPDNIRCGAPILALPEGSEDFIAYYDASKKGLGAVLDARREKILKKCSRLKLRINTENIRVKTLVVNVIVNALNFPGKRETYLRTKVGISTCGLEPECLIGSGAGSTLVRWLIFARTVIMHESHKSKYLFIPGSDRKLYQDMNEKVKAVTQNRPSGLLGAQPKILSEWKCGTTITMDSCTRKLPKALSDIHRARKYEEGCSLSHAPASAELATVATLAVKAVHGLAREFQRVMLLSPESHSRQTGCCLMCVTDLVSRMGRLRLCVECRLQSEHLRSVWGNARSY
ncbi:hypothetical protein Tco_1385008 [Tanacetum coccineum]